MNAIRIAPSLTLYSVTTHRLRCTVCQYSTENVAAMVGDQCPRCVAAGGDGYLERRPYHVDLEAYRGNGKCDCEQFRCKLEPAVKLIPATGPIALRIRCKHIDEALIEAKKEQNFTALLLALPDQNQEGQP